MATLRHSASPGSTPARLGRSVLHPWLLRALLFVGVSVVLAGCADRGAQIR
jgi:hypothetical protein